MSNISGPTSGIPSKLIKTPFDGLKAVNFWLARVGVAG